MGYTTRLPQGALPVQLTYISPKVILTKKVRQTPPQILHLSKLKCSCTAQVQFAVQLMQILCLGCIKPSFIMFCRRIFCTGKRTWFSVCTWLFEILVIAWTVSFFLFVFYCGTKPWKEWSTVLDIITYCPNAINDQMALAISDSIMDVVIIAMPIPQVCHSSISLCRGMLYSLTLSLYR